MVGQRRADNISLAPPRIDEDWLSLIIGLAIFLLALAGLVNINLIGWVVTTAVWNNLGAALNTASATYRGLGGVGALVATYLALLAVLGAAALALKSEPEEICAGVHRCVLHRLCELDRRQLRELRRRHAGRAAEVRHHLVAEAQNEGGYIFALLAGLVIANVFPSFAENIKDAVRPELYIKIAIVILGGRLRRQPPPASLASRRRCCCAALPPSSKPI